MSALTRRVLIGALSCACAMATTPSAEAQSRTWRFVSRAPFGANDGLIQCDASKDELVVSDGARLAVFERKGVAWTLETELKLPHAAEADTVSAAIDGAMIAVASRNAGTGYWDVFTKTGGSWAIATSWTGTPPPSLPASSGVQEHSGDIRPRTVEIAGGDVLTIEGLTLWSSRKPASAGPWTRQSVLTLPGGQGLFVAASSDRYAFGATVGLCHVLRTGKRASPTAAWVPLVQTTDMGSASASTFCGTTSSFVPLAATQGTPISLNDAAVVGDTVAALRSKFERFIDTSTPREAQLVVLDAKADGLNIVARHSFNAFTNAPYWRRAAFFDAQTLFVSTVGSATLGGRIDVYTRTPGGATWPDPLSPSTTPFVPPEGTQALDLFGEGLCTFDDYLVGTDNSSKELLFYHRRLEAAASCADDRECHSGFCTDGVCCESRCGGEDGAPSQNDCRACSTSAGGDGDGRCTALSAAKARSIVCRPPRTPTDPPETCQPGLSYCPADATIIELRDPSSSSGPLSDARPATESAGTGCSTRAPAERPIALVSAAAAVALALAARRARRRGKR